MGVCIAVRCPRCLTQHQLSPTCFFTCLQQLGENSTYGLCAQLYTPSAKHTSTHLTRSSQYKHTDTMHDLEISKFQQAFLPSAPPPRLPPPTTDSAFTKRCSFSCCCDCVHPMRPLKPPLAFTPLSTIPPGSYRIADYAHYWFSKSVYFSCVLEIDVARRTANAISSWSARKNDGWRVGVLGAGESANGGEECGEENRFCVDWLSGIVKWVCVRLHSQHILNIYILFDYYM